MHAFSSKRSDLEICGTSTRNGGHIDNSFVDLDIS